MSDMWSNSFTFVLVNLDYQFFIIVTKFYHPHPAVLVMQTKIKSVCYLTSEQFLSLISNQNMSFHRYVDRVFEQISI